MMQDPSLLEFAWFELHEKNKSVTVEEMAEVVPIWSLDWMSKYVSISLHEMPVLQIIFGCIEPLESYSAHLLLSKDEIYFTILESKGLRCVYGPRPSEQVDVLLSDVEYLEKINVFMTHRKITCICSLRIFAIITKKHTYIFLLSI
jgi:hypothetical protein